MRRRQACRAANSARLVAKNVVSGWLSITRLLIKQHEIFLDVIGLSPAILWIMQADCPNGFGQKRSCKAHGNLLDYADARRYHKYSGWECTNGTVFSSGSRLGFK